MQHQQQVNEPMVWCLAVINDNKWFEGEIKGRVILKSSAGEQYTKPQPEIASHFLLVQKWPQTDKPSLTALPSAMGDNSRYLIPYVVQLRYKLEWPVLLFCFYI